MGAHSSKTNRPSLITTHSRNETKDTHVGRYQILIPFALSQINTSFVHVNALLYTIERERSYLNIPNCSSRLQV